MKGRGPVIDIKEIEVSFKVAKTELSSVSLKRRSNRKQVNDTLIG